MGILGELAALGTAVCWSLTSTCFTIGGRHVGSVVVNRVRLAIAVVYLSIAHLFLHGSLLPIHAEPFRWFWLGVSGIIGLALGDAALFQAFVLVGPHLSMLLMSLVPLISTLIAWIFLNEVLTFAKIGGIFITVGGIILVVIKKGTFSPCASKKPYTIGILCGIAGAFGQALGLIAAKKGLMGDFSGLSATLIRVSIAMALIWIFTFIIRQGKTTILKLKNGRAFAAIAAGAFVGPFLGIWLSMIAIKFSYIGIASTLMALPPVFLLPISYWCFKEKITLLSVIGTVTAIIGSAVIFLT
jgi:drug/metabolite transporter (DMT)-like permease